MTDRRLDDAASIANDVELLHELEPEAARLYDRHASVAQEWFPHEYIPYRLGRDFDKEPWTPDQPRLTGAARPSADLPAPADSRGRVRSPDIAREIGAP